MNLALHAYPAETFDLTGVLTIANFLDLLNDEFAHPDTIRMLKWRYRNPHPRAQCLGQG